MIFARLSDSIRCRVFPLQRPMRISPPCRSNGSASGLTSARYSTPVPHAAFPSAILPIHPELAKPFHRDGWVFETKYDGWRVIAYKAGRHVRLVSRRGVAHTKRFSELAAAVARLPARTLILDGEVCVFDEALVSHMHLLMDPPADAAVTPPVFIAFDCLYARGQDLRSWPLKDRRKIMEDEIDGSRIVLPAEHLGDDGLEAWQRAQDRGLRG